MRFNFIVSLLCLLCVGPLSAEDVTIVLPGMAALQVTKPPAEMALDPFYEKYVSADGYPIVSSGKVNDYALKEAAYVVIMMLVKRPDVRDAMIKSGSRLAIMAYNEFTTDLPESA